MAIYDKTNTLLTEVVSSATSKPDVIEIVNRDLSGAYHVQTIGEAGTKLDVVAYFTEAQKMVFDGIKRISDSIRVVFGGRYYIGVIEGELSWSRYPNQGDVWFGTEFVLLVESEGVA